jgi:hypothetical protein
MSARCCRSTPRCGDCPVRLRAAARRAAAAAGAASLVAEVLGGAPPRPLPPGIVVALAELDDAQRGSRRRLATTARV